MTDPLKWITTENWFRLEGWLVGWLMGALFVSVFIVVGCR